MNYNKEIKEMIGNYFQYELWEQKDNFDEAFKKWKKMLHLKDIAIMYFKYWTIEPKQTEFKELKEFFDRQPKPKQSAKIQMGEEK